MKKSKIQCKIRKLVSLTFCALSFAFSAAVFANNQLPDKPPGKFFPLQAKDHKDTDSFKWGQPVVGTTYFYWYDIDTKSHIIDHDGTDALTTHPADMNGLSFNRVSWHKTQLMDMIEAGIDFLMPVYWGVPGKYDGWSFVGLPPLVEAHEALQKEGLNPPAIGLFYDTSILMWNGFNKNGSSYHVDLTTDFGKEWFYTAIRDFFSLIPPSKWARVDGRPIIFIYEAAFAKKQDPNQFAYTKRRFKDDYGVEPFIVKSPNWIGETDAVYSWGGAVSGPLIYKHVAALGPGYDHSAVPDRTPLIVKRLDGKTYIERWLKVLQLKSENRPWMVHVETWSEWHEGTDIAASREYDRTYIVLTRLFSDMWRTKTQIRLPSSYLDGNSVSWVPGQPKGITLADGGDGMWKKAKFDDVEAIVSAPNPHSDNRYLYFNVDDAFAYELFDRTVSVSVTYRDAGCSSFLLEYDSSNPQAGLYEGAFRPVGNVTISGTGKWKTAEFTLPQCRFMNRCNGADFRISVADGNLELAITKAALTIARMADAKTK
jgi:hypothetical protein